MNHFPSTRPSGLALLILALLASACSPAAPASPLPAETTAPQASAAPATQPPAAAPSDQGPLTVFEWSGYELPEFWQPFADQYPDVQVDFSFFADDAEAVAKLQTGFEVDVVHPCYSWLGQYIDSGLVQPIDTSRLSNWSGIIPELAKLGEVDGKQYFIPWDWGYETTLARTDKVQEVPDSYADLWDPQYAGHVSIYDAAESVWVVTALALGLDPYNTTPEQQQQIKQKMIELKPNLLNYWTDYSEIVQLVASGDVWLASNAWNDAYVLLQDENIPVVYTTPKEGRLGYVCGYVISSQAKNLDLAYAYIDAAIAPQSMANLSNIYGYGAANRDALALTDPEVVAALELDNPDILTRTYFYQPIDAALRDLITGIWSEVKAAP